MTLVKICGITNLDDARAAVAAGADMLGFNFYRPSPRFIEPEAARAIIYTVWRENAARPQSVRMVGVFVDEPSPEAITRIEEQSGVDGIQLHGDESAEFCDELLGLGAPFLIKVIRGDADVMLERAAEYNGDAIMVDAFDRDLRGGTGRTVDWELARRVGEVGPDLFLAGGLSPENVAEAIVKVRPYAVDACSALESSPGRKDPERMRAFVQAVRNA